MKLVSVNEMKAIEQEANAGGLSYNEMMENAGLGLAEIVMRRYKQIENRSVVGLVGAGKNGGDTLVALVHLAKGGWNAHAYFVTPRQAEDQMVARLEDAGVEKTSAGEDKTHKKLLEILHSTGILLDGVVGTGVSLPLRTDIARLLKLVGNSSPLRHIVAVDCPSGVDCLDGSVDEVCLPAEVTVCMAAVKSGLLTFPAFKYVGNLEVVDIGLPDSLASWKGIDSEVINSAHVQNCLHTRPMNAHKGTFGTALIVAGSVNYTGAALLAARGAYQAGVGLVRIAIPGMLHTALAGQLPEATWLLLPHETGVINEAAAEVLFKNLERATAILVGPGLGTEETTEFFLRKILHGKIGHSPKSGIGFVMENVENEEFGPSKLPPLVIDADGLNLLSRLPEWPSLVPDESILTPHPGEMSTLTGKSVEEIQANRPGCAREFAQKWNCVVVLKGALTVIAAPDGRVGVIPVATAALAKAGSGDALAGIIIGLRAQKIPSYEAATSGAWLHAQAGLRAAKIQGQTMSVLAGDVLDALPQVIGELEK